jgi:hypothetical protein
MITTPDETGLHRVEFPERTEEEESQRELYRTLEKKIDDDEDEYLLRLMRIRRSLWT